MPETTELVECRGLRCPEPVLRTAKAARGLGLGGGMLEIHADDDAFPLDLKSWVRSANAELVTLEESEQTYRALVRVPPRGAAPARVAPPAKPMPATLAATPVALAVSRQTPVPPAVAPAGTPVAPVVQAAPEAPAASGPRVLDYRGRQCPEPILELAKAARGAREPLEVLADDPAFPLDVRSWCRSSGANLEALTTEGTLHRALIYPKGVLRETMVAPASTHRAEPSPPPSQTPVSQAAAVATASGGVPAASFDLRDLPPESLDEELARIGQLRPGMRISLRVASSAGQQAVRWCAAGGHELLSYSGGEQVELVLGKATAVSSSAIVPVRPDDAIDCALLVMHNDLESLLAAMLVANGAAAQGMRTMVFFTFWGLNLLRADHPNLKAPSEPVSLMQRLFKWMMPRGPRRQRLGKLDFGGAGSVIMQGIMQDKNIRDLPSLIGSAREQGVTFVACTMSMTVMGITKRDLEPYDNLQYGGVAAFVEAARHASFSLMF